MIIGTCSICRGPVEVPNNWLCTIPPAPSCKRCGANADDDYGPVIAMRPRYWTGPWTPDISESLSTEENDRRMRAIEDAKGTPQ
jgi:hypothetical protein